MADAASLTFQRTGEQLLVLAKGAWTAANGAILDELIKSSTESSNAAVSIDARGVTALDTYGACLLGTLSRRLRTGGKMAEISGLDPKLGDLYRTVERTAHPAPPQQHPAFALGPWLASIGRSAVALQTDLTKLVNMLGQIGAAAVTIVRQPRTLRLTSTVHQLDRVGLQAVPIILLITFLIGCILAQQGFFHFRRFGADQYVVDMVGILVVREIGVLLVAIMVAGRSGSSYTAELGSMKMREEIDAVRTMGLDPIGVLVLPRILALVIALPALTLLGSLAALYGGGLVAWLYGDMSPDIYLARLREAISADHFKVGIIKAPFMALVIGAVACSEGLQVGGSAESLGLRTTSSVVKSIFLVIVLDGLFAMYFASIGI